MKSLLDESAFYRPPLGAVERRDTVNDDCQKLVLAPARIFPPASRQMRAATVSRLCPLRPRIPATEQAERWWPKLSRRRPHTHERRRNLRSSKTRKGCGSIRHEKHHERNRRERGRFVDLSNVASLFENTFKIAFPRSVTRVLAFSSSTTSGSWTSPEAN